MKSTLTPSQIGIAMGEISMSLAALERISIMLQVAEEHDSRNVDALHTLTQNTLQRAGLIAELVTIHSGGQRVDAPKGAEPWQWFMPPSFFTT